MEQELPTDSMNELDFRHLAGLCERCGNVRCDEDVNICVGCRQADYLALLARIEVPRMRRITKCSYL